MYREVMNRGTEVINDNKWKQHLGHRNREFHLFRANTAIATNTNLQDGTKRKIKIDFEHKEEKPIVDSFSITSGKEVALHIAVQTIVKDYKKLHPNSFITFEIIDILNDSQQEKAEEDTESIRSVKVRIKQSQFRANLLKKCGRCQVTGLDEESLLVASHIKRWDSSNNSERVDVYNGLLLNVAVDALFDKGYISFKFDGSIMISSQYPAEIFEILNVFEDSKISAEKEQKHYLKWHQENVFKQ